MSNVLSLAMKINADASGFKLDPVQRALVSLGNEADKVTAQFGKFATESEAAGRVQRQFADQLQALQNALRDGSIGATQFAVEFDKLAKAAEAEAKAFEQAAKITEASLTPAQRYQRAVAELDAQLKAGRISQETYSAAVAKAKATLDSTTASVDKQKLKFNELSGVLSALPGPFGSIAGRISGLSSAGEGLGRVFSGGISQGLSGIGTSLAGLANPLTAATVGVAAFGASAAAVAQGLIALEDRVEKLGNTADKLGVSFQFVQVLDEAARRSGTSIDAVSGAFGRLQKSVLGVDEESKAAQKALAEIGITAQQLQSLKPEDQYQLIGQRLASIEDPARRTATAVSLFGKSGSELIPFFNNIKGAATDIERLGATLSDVQRRNVDNFGGAMDRLAVSTRGAKEQLLAELAPAATRTADTLAVTAAGIGKSAGFIVSVLDNTAGSLGLDAFTNASTAFDKVSASQERAAQAAEKNKNALQGVAQATESIQELSAKSQESLAKAIDSVGEFGQAGFDVAFRYQEALREIDAQVADTTLTEEQANRARQNARVEYERQIEVVKQSVEEQQKAAAAAEEAARREVEAVQSIIDKTLERIRIEKDFGGDSARAQNAADLNRVRDEIAKAEASIAAASESGDERNAKAAAERLSQLQTVRDELAKTEAQFADAADQAAVGFASGFEKAFEETTRGLNDLTNKAAEFGNEGAIAAQQLQQGIADAQEKVRGGIFNKAAYDAEIAAQRQLFQERLDQFAGVRELEERWRNEDLDRRAAQVRASIQQQAEQEQAAIRRRVEQEQAAFQRQVAANERLNQFMMALDGGRQQAEAAAAEEAAKRRQEAVENLAAIEERIATQRQAIEAAREQNDLKSAKARREELKQLEALRKQEEAIADGRVAASQRINSATQANAQAQAAQQEAFTRSVQQQVGSLQAAAGGAIEATNQAFAKAAERQQQLIRELNNLGSRTISVPDARTAEGAALVLSLGANALDPRLVEARLTNKILREVVTGLAGNLNRIGVPATVL